MKLNWVITQKNTKIIQEKRQISKAFESRANIFLNHKRRKEITKEEDKMKNFEMLKRIIKLSKRSMRLNLTLVKPERQIVEMYFSAA